MASTHEDIKQHVSIQERLDWKKLMEAFATHLGSGGFQNHRAGNGVVPGFSMNDFTNRLLEKLNGIEEGALNNPHPDTHPREMITGLHQVSWTGDYNHLINIPKTFYAGGGNADTVGGIRITIGTAAPNNPQENKEIWINTSDRIIYIYLGGKWQGTHAVYA